MSLAVDFGTPVSGSIVLRNKAGEAQSDFSDLQAGSLAFASSDETIFQVVPDLSTGKFSVAQVAAGTADVMVSAINSKGEAVSGKNTLTLNAVVVVTPPDTVVESIDVVFDQATA